MVCTDTFHARFRIGIDVGSTTVKAVVVEALPGEILWQDYRRHDTRQAEMLLDFLLRMESDLGMTQDNSPGLHDRIGRELCSGTSSARSSCRRFSRFR